jgi:NADH:ubiquinone oxidoreductase subunit 3 (subunit A)
MLISSIHFSVPFFGNIKFFIPYLLSAVVLTVLLGVLSLVVQNFLHAPYAEKTSAYECGFQPFSKIAAYTVQYYLISLIFILFDIEIVFLVPIILTINYPLTLTFFLTLFLFNIILWAGYIIEYSYQLLSFPPY